MSAEKKRSLVVALCGGIGGAKLALGLSRIVPGGDLMLVGNTGDDFEHLGLMISPDLDTVMYTLAGLDDPKRGWGRRNETWTFMGARAAVEVLSAITADFCRRLGIAARLVPMTDDRVRTRVRTEEGWLDFQDYFVRRRCAPPVREIAYDGAASARAHPDMLAALRDPRLRAIVICPSNPFLSIEPILAVTGLREAIARAAAPVVAVSPIIGGRAVKGPTAKMMSELGCEVTAAAVARRYQDLLDAYVVDHRS